VSQLALGHSGWVERANFFVTGMLVLAGAAGLRRSLRPDRVIPSLVALTGVAFVTATFFPTNLGAGYPPGTGVSPKMIAHGQIHDLAGGLFFISLSAAQIVYGRRCWRRRRPGFARYSVCSFAVMIGALILSSAGMAQVTGFKEVGGLFERLSLMSGFIWLTALMVGVSRQAHSSTPSAAHDHAL